MGERHLPILFPATPFLPTLALYPETQIRGHLYNTLLKISCILITMGLTWQISITLTIPLHSEAIIICLLTKFLMTFLLKTLTPIHPLKENTQKIIRSIEKIQLSYHLRKTYLKEIIERKTKNDTNNKI